MPAVPVVDLARADRGARARAVGARSPACSRRGVFLLGPETEAFEAEFAAFCGRRHAVAVASGTEALRLALRRDGRRRRRRGDRPRDDRGADRGRGACAAGRGAGVRRRRRRDRDARSRGRGRGGDRPHPRRDPGAPLRPAGRDPRPRRPGARGRGAGARRARPGGAERGGRRTPSTRRRTSAASATAAPSSPTTPTSRRDPRALRNHARGPTTTTHPIVSPGTRGCRRSRPPRCGSACAASRPTTRAARAVAAAYRDAAPDLRWQAPHPRHVYHLCVARVADREAWRAAPPVRHRGALRAGAHAAAGVPRATCGTRALKPRPGRPSAYRCPAFPR